MEEIKKTVLNVGKNLLDTALKLVKAGAEGAANVLGRLAGHAVAFVRDQGGAVVKSAGAKVKQVAADNRQTLLLIAAAVSGLVMIASLVGFLLGRKK